MQITEQELAAILQRNPHLHIHDYGAPSKRQRRLYPDSEELTREYAKYRNRRVYVYEDGFIFFSGKETGHGKVARMYSSVREYRRHQELILMEKAGKIHDLKWQYKLILQDGFIHREKKISPITYVADFFYYVDDQPEPTIEDVKGLDRDSGKHIMTEAFRLKWKMAMHRYPNYHFVVY